ncbi:hypothetical protein GJ699_03565 [Duganella sp. FT80W]|uniref:Uncharacterized protein n=1 Tax=Duganella guangzhouensis TaxID=2666084 RepID=A0A6I2KT25_9BURK|nr:hypothetical protein [Duganella guangzhouensis]MRW89055.1 hypothetical protein [Duganella guangzhouensis]
MRKAAGVVFMVLAGFVFSIVTLCAFFGGIPPAGKVAMMVGFTVVALVPHAIGLALAGFRQWKRYTGIVLLSVAGYTAFVAFSFACMYFSDDVRRLFPPETTMIFGSIPTGLIVLTISAALGWLLLKEGHRSDS